jgi:hypothetical protein
MNVQFRRLAPAFNKARPMTGQAAEQHLRHSNTIEKSCDAA